MSRLKKLIGVACAAVLLLPLSAFALLLVNERTLPRRTARYEADLRAKVPPGSSPEQLREWLSANGFCHGQHIDLERWGAMPSRPVSLWVDDPAWPSGGDIWIELRFDEQGRVLSTRITSSVVSL